MKKGFLTLFVLLTLSLCACVKNNVEWLNDWSFQYNEGTSDYSLFFALYDEKKNPVAADADLSVRIVNENGAEVYAAEHSVTKDDYGYYTSMVAGEQFLAEVRIPETDIIEGNSGSGTVYLTVQKEGRFLFDEVNLSASSLPIADVELVTQQLPVELAVKDYFGKKSAVIRVEEMAYEFEKGYMPALTITLSGVKIYGVEDSYSGMLYDMIDYKLYDSEEIVVDAGTIYLDSLSEGDKFRDDSIVFYEAIPGESYTLKLLEHKQ